MTFGILLLTSMTFGIAKVSAKATIFVEPASTQENISILHDLLLTDTESTRSANVLTHSPSTSQFVPSNTNERLHQTPAMSHSQANMPSDTPTPLFPSSGFPLDFLQDLFSSLSDSICAVADFFLPTEPTLPTEGPTTSESTLSSFEVDYDLEMYIFDALLDVDEMRGVYEYTMQAMFNIDAYGTDTKFLRFDVEQRSQKKNRRKSSAKGICQTKKCDVPSSYGFPKTITPEETYLFELFKTTPYALPDKVYVMKKTRDENGLISYISSFQPKIVYPWSSFPGFTIEQIPGSLQLKPYVSCQVTEDECDSQREAMMSVFYDLSLSYYITDETECLWEGVSCDDTFRITHFQADEFIYSEPISKKPLPTGIYDLVHLMVLSLRTIGLTGTIDPRIGNLKELTELNLGGNELTGTIPVEIGLLEKMEGLCLGSNDLMGGIPPELGNLEDLTILDISENPNLGQSTSGKTLKAPIPTEFGNLQSLKEIKLYNSRINATLPASFGSLVELEKIDIDNNNILGDINVFSTLTKLGVLQSDGNGFTGSFSDAFADLNQLRIMSLKNSDIAGPFPTFIGSFTHLTDFVVGGTDITGSLPSEIGTLENLTSLDVAYSNIGGELPSEIENLKKLKTLNLVGNTFHGTLATELGSLESLEAMVLAGNAFTGTIPTEFGMLVNVLAIDIARLSLTGQVPTELNNLDKLEDIALGGNQLTGNVGFLCELEYTDISLSDFPNTDCNVTQESAVDQLLTALGVLNYSSGSSECEWTGVSCNIENKVIEIVLDNLGLDGSIPDVIGQIHFLEALDLSNNMLQGTVPEAITFPPFLKSINISNNDLTGDAAFLCGTVFQVAVDEGEVYTCTNPPSLSLIPSVGPSDHPSFVPSPTPSANPSASPSLLPSSIPSSTPSISPSTSLRPSDIPSGQPTTINIVRMGKIVGEGTDEVGQSCALSSDGLVAVIAGLSSINIRTYDGSAYGALVDLSSMYTSTVTSIHFSADGSTFITGEMGFDSERGAAIVFKFDDSDSSWKNIGQKLQGTNVGDGFGVDVDVNEDGTIIAVGAHHARYVKLLELNTETSSWDDKYDVARNDEAFGVTVQISGDANRLVTCANGADNAGADSGSCFVYTLGSLSSTLVAQFDGNAAGDRLGTGLAASTDGLVLAASTDGGYVKLMRADDDTRSGYTLMFDVAGEANEVALSANGSRLAVGSWRHDGNRGKFQLFAVNNHSANELRVYIAVTAGNNAGKSVAISDNGTVFMGSVPYSQLKAGKAIIWKVQSSSA